MLHRSAVEDQLLFMKSKLSEEKIIFNQVYHPLFIQGGMVFKKLVRENESGIHARMKTR
jgi:hypothetical protein